jgi:hypothetical protein
MLRRIGLIVRNVFQNEGRDWVKDLTAAREGKNRLAAELTCDFGVECTRVEEVGGLFLDGVENVVEMFID